MMNLKARLVFFFALFFCLINYKTFAQTYQLSNSAFVVSADLNAIKVTSKNNPQVSSTLKPSLQLIKSLNDPLMSEKRSDNGLSPQVSWKNPKGLKIGNQPAIPAKAEENETDFYKVGAINTYLATAVKQVDKNLITYTFPKNKSFELKLNIRLSEGSENPIIETELVAKENAWYSVGFNGISEQDASKLDFLYQPMIWSWKRFPEKAYLTAEKFATTAATFTNNGKFTEGIAPDPTEIPYRFANIKNSLFGLIIRNQNEKAQPMIFAPILGGEQSHMKSGTTFKFQTRYLLHPGPWNEGMANILNNIFHYKNERQNATVTLNQTLDNIIAIAMNDKSGGWIDSLKGFNYEQDAIGTVKVVSALHQLGTAMVTGNEDIYAKRALPTIEYVMSREKYLYTVDERQKIQSPSHFLKGPCVEIGELSGLYQLTKGQTFAFQSEMNRLFGKTRKLNLNTETGGGTWQDYLYRYRVSKNKADLEKAVSGADEYLKIWQPYPSVFTNDPGLRDKASAFMTDFAPKIYDMMEMYEETKKQAYLDMALLAGRQMILWMRSNPMAPDSLILVNQGNSVTGMARKHYKINSKEGIPGFDYATHIQEQYVPAWQTSLVGLPPEQPYTYANGPIMLVHHPAWFLKLAYLTKDSLLKTAAYNAILGRYAGFPGYYFTSLHTNVYQRADYAAHDFLDIKYNFLFHNHIFPHITLLIDFLVNDAYYRSGGQVDFPGVYAPGYAYLTSKVYGNKLGTIFGNKNIRLWLPANGIQANTPAFNHLFGIGNNDFYVVLMNTFKERVNTQLRINPDVVPWVEGKEYQVSIYYKNGKVGKSVFKDGMLAVDAAAEEMLAYKIEGLKVEVPLFNKMDAQSTKTGSESFFRDEQTGNFGNLTGMLINTFPQFSDAYIYTDKTEKDFKQVTINYKIGNQDWKTIVDKSYPYEFSIHLANPAEKLEVNLTAIDLQGNKVQSKSYILKNN